MIEAVPNYTAWQISQGTYRREVLERLWFLERHGATRSEAVKELKVPESTLRDWLRLYAKNNDWNDLIPKVSTGRKSACTKLTQQIGDEATAKVIATVQANNLQTGTNSGSWRFCTATNDFPQVVKDMVLDPTKASKHHIPKSLTAATKVTRAQRLAFQGRRALALNGGYVPRFLDVTPGDVFVPDDKTPSWGWWVPWPRSEAYPFGRKLLQGQLIGLVDFACLFRPGYALVAREHSSYRAADIWSFYGDMFRSVGLPRLGFQHEGGTFQANALRGVEVEYQPGEFDRQRRVGALSMLPSTLLPCHHQMAQGRGLSKRLEVYHSLLPKSKIIELAFSMMSKLEVTLWGYLGNDQRARPIERTVQIYDRCRRGAADPALYFLSYTEIREKLDRIIAYLNQDSMEGYLRQGRPLDLWLESITANPLLKLPDELAFFYRRDWKLRTVKGPFIDLSYTDQDTREKVRLHYTNAEAFAHLDGQEVVVYYDRLQPEQEAQIVTPSGEYLCAAQYWSGTGAFLARNPEGFEITSKYNNTVMSLTSVIAAHASSRQLPPEIDMRRQRAAADRREEQRTPFSQPRSGTRNGTAAAPVSVPAASPQQPRRTPAELLDYQPDAAKQPELEAAPEPTRARPAYRVVPWHERVHDDGEVDRTDHSPPPRGGKEKTPLEANQAGSVKTAN